MSEEITEMSPRQDRLQDIILSYVEAADNGKAPDRHTFLAAHPDFAEELADFLTSYDQLNLLASPLRKAPERTASELGQLGDYRLLREIGRGGMGVVYEAEQISLRRHVALKILPFVGGVDTRQLQRFRNEAEAAAHLHHPHIVPVFAIGSERGVHYYAMQFIEGQSLAALIAALVEGQERAGADQNTTRQHEKTVAASTPATSVITTAHSARTNRFFQTVAAIGRQTAEALEYAHQTGIIHRDIKPANLMLDSRGDVWITDFGLAQFQSQVGLTMTGELLGTLRYVSPEQALAKRGAVDHHTDIYSLGATLYELLTLKPVFDGKDRHALLNQIALDEPKPLRAIDPSIPLELETIVLKALAKNPSERYGSAQEMADDLQRFLEDKPIQARRPTVVERARRWLRRHPAYIAASILLLLVGVIASVVSVILIAREQWKTQVAYEKLEVEEKQTKNAFAKLAAEQERTSEAFRALAKQQTRTKEALASEERQRYRAEGDYEQARRALELIVQFSEGELAHHPAHQEVRRRLLETVLDYYEDFLARHEDDPDVRAALVASRERAAVILTELAGLRGLSVLAIVQDVAVQKDLGVEPEQKKKLDQAVANLAKEVKPFGDPFKHFGPKPPPKDKGYRVFPSANAVDQALSEILSMAQKQRLQQVLLQVQQQGRHGFSDPKLVAALSLSSRQRADIRKIQAEAHRSWADHLFSDKKIDKPAEFWSETQEQILAILRHEQMRKWQAMIGTSVAVELREGYPCDGLNLILPRPGPVFGFPSLRDGTIVVAQGKDRPEFSGSGFGHKRHFDDRQYYCWQGKEIPPTAFEIAVTTQPLTDEERRHVIGKIDSKATTERDAPPGWVVLFRAQDPSLWDTDSPDENRFAIPLAQAHDKIRYLRLKRMDTGEMQIILIAHADLTQQPNHLGDREVAWSGAANESFNARHLGIAQGPEIMGPPGKDRPRKGKGGPPKK